MRRRNPMQRKTRVARTPRATKLRKANQRQSLKVARKRYPVARMLPVAKMPPVAKVPRWKLLPRNPQSPRLWGSWILSYLILWKGSTGTGAASVGTERGARPVAGAWEVTYSRVNSNILVFWICIVVFTTWKLFSQLGLIIAIKLCSDMISESQFEYAEQFQKRFFLWIKHVCEFAWFIDFLLSHSVGTKSCINYMTVFAWFCFHDFHCVFFACMFLLLWFW